MIRSHVLICGGTGCSSSGSQTLQAEFNKQIEAFGLSEEVKLVQTGCFGLCARSALSLSSIPKEPSTAALLLMTLRRS